MPLDANVPLPVTHEKQSSGSVKLLFTSPFTLSSYLIRAFTWSQWSHVALIDPELGVIEAVPVHGVRASTLERVIDKPRLKYSILELPVLDSEKLINTARSFLGAEYDWRAIFGLICHGDWQDDHKWDCAELVAYCFYKAGSPLFNPKFTHRVTPQMLFQVPCTRLIETNVEDIQYEDNQTI